MGYECQEAIEDLDVDLVDAMDIVLDRILNQMKKDDPERYERARKKAEVECNKMQGNGGNGSKRRDTSKNSDT